MLAEGLPGAEAASGPRLLRERGRWGPPGLRQAEAVREAAPTRAAGRSGPGGPAVALEAGAAPRQPGAAGPVAAGAEAAGPGLGSPQ